MKHEEQIDYESIKKRPLNNFVRAKSLTGKVGSFTPLFKQFLEAAHAGRQ
jgi:hypothetical protein